jgi:hypothetical protein
MCDITSLLSTTSKKSSDDRAGVGAVQRIASIDILRALTMAPMIFVNDFRTLNGVPYRMEHRKQGFDGIGLIKSFLFAIHCVLITGVLIRINVPMIL